MQPRIRAPKRSRIVVYWKGSIPNDALIVKAIQRLRSTGARVVRVEDDQFYPHLAKCAFGLERPSRLVSYGSVPHGATIIEAEVLA